MIQGINRSVIRQSIILIVKLMSFKTSVLIWFSRFRGTASPPTPLLQRGGRLTGWGFCVRQKNMGFEDRVTEEHRGIVTWFYTEGQKNILFNDIGFGDMVKQKDILDIV